MCRKVWLAAAATATVLAALLFIFVVALFHLHFDNWTGVDNFFPFGLRSVRMNIIDSAGPSRTTAGPGETFSRVTSGEKIFEFFLK